MQRGHSAIPNKWRERRIHSFEKDPLKCQYCGAEMELWQIVNPKYGLIWDFIHDNIREVNTYLEIEDLERKEDKTIGFRQILFGFMKSTRIYEIYSDL